MPAIAREHGQLHKQQQPGQPGAEPTVAVDVLRAGQIWEIQAHHDIMDPSEARVRNTS